MEFYFPSKTWNQNFLLSSYHNGRKTEITFCIINNWKLKNWLEEQSSSIQFLAVHSWYGWSIKVGWWLADWLGGWPTGSVSYYITTLWLHLEGWLRIQDGAECGNNRSKRISLTPMQFNLLLFCKTPDYSKKYLLNEFGTYYFHYSPRLVRICVWKIFWYVSLLLYQGCQLQIADGGTTSNVKIDLKMKATSKWRQSQEGRLPQIEDHLNNEENFKN